MKDDAQSDIVDDEQFNLDKKKDQKGNLRQEIMERFEEIAKQFNKTQQNKEVNELTLGN